MKAGLTFACSGTTLKAGKLCKTMVLSTLDVRI
jgi:hypothetical protein